MVRAHQPTYDVRVIGPITQQRQQRPSGLAVLARLAQQQRVLPLRVLIIGLEREHALQAVDALLHLAVLLCELCELLPLVHVALREVRGHHEELERFGHLARLLVDEAERLVRVRQAGRHAHDLEQQLDGLLELAVGVHHGRLADHALHVRVSLGGRHGRSTITESASALVLGRDNGGGRRAVPLHAFVRHSFICERVS